MSHVCFAGIISNCRLPKRASLLSVQCAAPTSLLVLSESSMAGGQGNDPSSLSHCTRSADACRAIACATARKGGPPLCPLQWAVRATRHWGRGMHAGQGSWGGRHLHVLAPLGRAVPWCVGP